MSALSDLLSSQPMTARQVADKAEAEGVDLRYGTLAGYWAGNHGRPTQETLAKLAKVVPQLSEAKLQEAAWGKPAPLGPYRPIKESVHLTGQQRRALDRLIKSIVDEQGVTHAVPSDSSAPSGASPQAGPPQEAGGSLDESQARAARRRADAVLSAELQRDRARDDREQPG